jgi:hypothetical protein
MWEMLRMMISLQFKFMFNTIHLGLMCLKSLTRELYGCGFQSSRDWKTKWRGYIPGCGLWFNPALLTLVKRDGDPCIFDLELEIWEGEKIWNQIVLLNARTTTSTLLCCWNKKMWRFQFLVKDFIHFWGLINDIGHLPHVHMSSHWCSQLIIW